MKMDRPQILYVMHGEKKAPAGTGTVDSWFRYYKWEVEGETYVPQSPPIQDVQEGDILWFIMDGEVLGYVPLLHVREDAINGRQEFWYNADKIYRSQKPLMRIYSCPETCQISSGSVQHLLVDLWNLGRAE